MRLPRSMRAWGIGLLALATAQPAFAQIDEADRLERCRNNRAALAQLETTRASYATEEQIARARTAMVSIRRLQAEFEKNRAEANSFVPYLGPSQENAGGETQKEKFDYKAHWDRLIDANVKIGEQIRQIGISVNFGCGKGDFGCQYYMPQRLAKGIDAAVAQQPQRQQFLQQVESYRSNLAVLGCDGAGQQNFGGTTGPVSAFPDMAGLWRGGNGGGSTYSFSQNGADVSWTRNDNDEVGTATVTRNSISASYRSSYGTGSSGGTIEFDTTGRAVRIRWGNGDTYVRQ